MAFSEFEVARVRKTVGDFVEKRRPPPSIRPQLDLGFHVDGQSVVLFELRPVWRGAPGELLERPYAKATWVKASRTWKVFWQRADLKWHRYVPLASARTIEEFLNAVAADEYHCFLG
ncbi:MAG: DUF3024 domain-containing protein [Dokdonella sp.]